MVGMLDACGVTVLQLSKTIYAGQLCPSYKMLLTNCNNVTLEMFLFKVEHAEF